MASMGASFRAARGAPRQGALKAAAARGAAGGPLDFSLRRESTSESDSERSTSGLSSSSAEDFDEFLFWGSEGPLEGMPKKRRKRKRNPFTGQRQKKRRKRKTADTPSNLTPELRDLLRQATDLYLSAEFAAAAALLKEIIRRAPGLHDPFHLLGLVFEEGYKDKRRALDCYILAAQLVGSDALLWRRSGNLAVELGDLGAAAFALKNCLKCLKEKKELKELKEAKESKQKKEAFPEIQSDCSSAAAAAAAVEGPNKKQKEFYRIAQEVAFQLALVYRETVPKP
ncbi:general transcription factor IIIC, putative [Eimeria tenella]|uniref:General transcription factor IIIC, putative n=1 Tax=Eimeria tenella TaxID=5802 RepID=U6L0B5_EIMTE|nr:general transcription factor IIIC, putative [Eimeria tenella]CDJ43857.1 general transcription factor IIIC, putative [Eimeria tenella]|eukprot:XP_013234606.1 general transcription factor IIIC, putative [Eimeria tenella]